MKVKKLTAMVLSAAMVVSLAAASAFAAPPEGGAPGGEGGGPGGPGGAPSILTLQDPEYTYQEIENVTSISDVVTADNLTGLAQIVVGATVNGQEVEGLLTMTRNGEEVPVAAGEYTEADNVVITVTNYLQDADENGDLVALGSWNAISGLPYRTALSVKDGEMVEEESVTSAIQGATPTASSISGAVFKTSTSGMSGIILRDSDYTISDVEITMLTESDGTDVNDFAGYGAGVVAYGDSKVIIENSTIETTGVAKAATFADSGADLIVRGSVLKSNGGDIYPEYKSTANQSYMINPPWVLGIVGSARTTNVMGDYTTGTYVDTDITADAWGAMSIDTGNYMRLTAINTDITVEGSGYGAYAIGTGTIEDYYGSTFDVDTYAVIMTGATVNLNSVTEGDEINIYKVKADESARGASADDTDNLVTTETATATANTVINSKNFGFMMHHNGSDGWNILNVNEGTEINTGNAAFLVKKINAEINLDNATVNSGNGVILQMIDNDDDMVGAFMDDFYGMPTFNYTFTEPDGWSSTWGVDYQSSGWQTELNVTDTVLEGDVFNGTGYTANGGSVLNVNLGAGASLTGAISATEIQHGDSLDELYKTFTYREDDEGFNYDTAAAAASKLGHVINQNYYNGVNDVNVTLTDDAAWKVTADCVVTNVTAVSTAITADEPVTITVNGTLTLDGEVVTGDTKVVGNVTYVLAEEEEPAEDLMANYTDLAADAWYATGADGEAVNYVLANALMGGRENPTTFAPSATLTRAELAVILYRAAGSPAVSEDALTAPDAASVGVWAQDAMKWAVAEGIITGDPAGNLLPAGTVDRETMAVMLCRWAEGSVAEGADLSAYTDAASVSTWAVNGMTWAVAEGVIQGSGSELAPGRDMTRIEAAIMLGRYLQNQG